MEVRHALLLYRKENVLLPVGAEENFATIHWSCRGAETIPPSIDPGEKITDEDITYRSNEGSTCSDYQGYFERGGDFV